MTSLISPVHRIRCDQPGCTKSYLRVEHLNRHRLTHQTGEFCCYLCKKQFSRNDLLQSHLRRHERRNDHKLQLDKRNKTLSPSPGTTATTATQDASYTTLAGPSTETIWTSDAVESIPSQDPGFPWPFRDGGIFGLPDESSLGMSPDVLPDAYLDEYSNFQGVNFGNFPPVVPNNIVGLGEDGSIPLAVYQKLVQELPHLSNDSLGDPVSLLRLYRLSLDYASTNMPFFHRPTIDLTTLPTLLILALCSLGASVSHEPESQKTASMIHGHVWQRMMTMVSDLRQVDITTLETMLVIEHVGFYALSRAAHEKADVFHAMLVILARRSSFLAQDSDLTTASRQPIDTRWREWAERETVKRVSYAIFVHDVDYAMHFMHPAQLWLGMMKLPLPCSTALWQARTAEEWEAEMHKTRQPSRSSSLKSLRPSVEALLNSPGDHASQRKPGGLQAFSSGAFTIQILVHGLASAVLEQRFRALETGCSQAMHILKLKEFEQGLANWYTCFQRLDMENEASSMARSSLITYHLVTILLNESLSDIQMAAGTAYSWGRAVTPQRAQDAFSRLVTREPVAKEAYGHALKIMRLCLTGSTHAASTPPLYLNFNAFIAVLVLWAYALGLSRPESTMSHQQDPSRNLVWLMDDERLVASELARSSRGLEDATSIASSVSGDGIEQILHRGLVRPDTKSQEVEVIRSDVRHLMSMVVDRLGKSDWEIAVEARRVLEALLEKNGFMEYYLAES